jgi:hypothetical protein
VGFQRLREIVEMSSDDFNVQIKLLRTHLSHGY